MLTILENAMHQSFASASGAARPRFTICPFRQFRADWLARAALLPGRSLHYAMAVHMLASIANSAVVSPGPQTLARFGVSSDAAADALTRLTRAGLVRADRKRGRVPSVTLLDAQGNELALRAGGAV